MIATALFFVLMPAAFLSFIMKRRIEYFIGAILPFWGILLYLGGMCRILNFTYYAIVSAIWLMIPIWLGIIVYGGVTSKGEKLREYLHRIANLIATPGCVLFIIGTYFARYASEGRCFYHWDAFSHWGRIVNVIFENNVLPITDSQVLKLILYKSYPVGTSIVEYMFVRFYDASKLSESTVMFAMAMIEISALLIITVKSSWKNAWMAALYFLAALLACGSFSPMFLSTTYVDPLLGIVMGGACFLIMEETRFSWFNSVLLTIFLGYLILIKDSGSGLAIIVLSIPLSIGIYNVVRSLLHKKPHELLSHSRYFIPLLALLLRIIHKASLAGVRVNFSSKNISFEKLADGFSYWGKSPFHIIWTRMYERTCFAKLPGWDIPISIFPLSVLLCIAIFLLAALFHDRRKCIVRIVSILAFVGFLVYAFTLFVYYAFVFIPSEGLSLAAFDRYMSTYMIFEYMILLSVGVCLLESAKARANNIGFCIALMPILNISGWKDLFRYCEPINNLDMTCYSAMDQILTPHLGKKQKFFVIANSQGLEGLVAASLWPNNFYATKCVAWRGLAAKNKYSKPYSESEIMDLIKNTDYCYIASRNDDFSQTYGKYFDDKAQEGFALYKCDGTMFRRLPLKRYVFDFGKVSLLRYYPKNALVSASMKSHRLDVKVYPKGEVKIFPMPKFCPLHCGKVSKIVIHFDRIHGDGRWELKTKSKLLSSGSMASVGTPLIIDLTTVKDFDMTLVKDSNFNFIVSTTRDQQCAFSISRVEVHYHDNEDKSPEQKPAK
jgi:hypothetical protein